MRLGHTAVILKLMPEGSVGVKHREGRKAQSSRQRERPVQRPGGGGVVSRWVQVPKTWRMRMEDVETVEVHESLIIQASCVCHEGLDIALRELGSSGKE